MKKKFIEKINSFDMNLLKLTKILNIDRSYLYNQLNDPTDNRIKKLIKKILTCNTVKEFYKIIGNY